MSALRSQGPANAVTPVLIKQRGNILAHPDLLDVAKEYDVRPIRHRERLGAEYRYLCIAKIRNPELIIFPIAMGEALNMIRLGKNAGHRRVIRVQNIHAEVLTILHHLRKPAAPIHTD